MQHHQPHSQKVIKQLLTEVALLNSKLDICFVNAKDIDINIKRFDWSKKGSLFATDFYDRFEKVWPSKVDQLAEWM